MEKKHKVTPELLELGLRLVGMNFDKTTFGRIVDVIKLIEEKGGSATIDDTVDIFMRWEEARRLKKQADEKTA